MFKIQPAGPIQQLSPQNQSQRKLPNQRPEEPEEEAATLEAGLQEELIEVATEEKEAEL